jgi:hypothetical protein
MGTFGSILERRANRPGWAPDPRNETLGRLWVGLFDAAWHDRYRAVFAAQDKDQTAFAALVAMQEEIIAALIAHRDAEIESLEEDARHAGFSSRGSELRMRANDLRDSQSDAALRHFTDWAPEAAPDPEAPRPPDRN